MKNLHVVAKPLHHRAADEDATFQRILKLPLHAAGQHSNQALLRHGERVTTIWRNRKQPVP